MLETRCKALNVHKISVKKKVKPIFPSREQTKSNLNKTCETYFVVVVVAININTEPALKKNDFNFLIHYMQLVCIQKKIL